MIKRLVRQCLTALRYHDVNSCFHQDSQSARSSASNEHGTQESKAFRHPALSSKQKLSLSALTHHQDFRDAKHSACLPPSVAPQRLLLRTGDLVRSKTVLICTAGSWYAVYTQGSYVGLFTSADGEIVKATGNRSVQLTVTYQPLGRSVPNVGTLPCWERVLHAVEAMYKANPKVALDTTSATPCVTVRCWETLHACTHGAGGIPCSLE